MGYSEIIQWFEEHKVTYAEDVMEHTGKKVLRFNQRIAKGNTVLILFVFTDIGIKMIFLDIANVDVETKISECYKLLNRFNGDFNYVKFVVTGEGEIRAEADIILTLRDGEFDADEFMKLFISVFSVIEKIYPELMRIQWA